MKYILCECGKRYREDNKKHFESEEHKKYIRKQQLQQSNEVHIICYDIDKDKLMEYIKNNCTKKRKYAIDEEKIIDDDPNDKDYNPEESSDSSDGENVC